MSIRAMDRMLAAPYAQDAQGVTAPGSSEWSWVWPRNRGAEHDARVAEHTARIQRSLADLRSRERARLTCPACDAPEYRSTGRDARRLCAECGFSSKSGGVQ